MEWAVAFSTGGLPPTSRALAIVLRQHPALTGRALCCRPLLRAHAPATALTCRSSPPSLPSTQPVLTYHDREQYQSAQHQLPPGAYPAFEVEDVEDEREQEHPDERRADAALPARQERPADDDCGYRVQLPPDRRHGLTSPESRREQHARQSRHRAAQRVDPDGHAPDVQTQKPRRLFAVAESVRVSPEAR